MSISKKTFARLAVLSVLIGLGVATACRPPDECIRFSDCDEGLTCAEGRCVVPANTPDPLLDGSVDADSDASLDADADADVDGGADASELDSGSDGDAEGHADAETASDAATDAPADG